MAITSIHPFPARMAPEIARRYLGDVPENGNVLDPMCGSGTVVRAAVEAGLQCVGTDIDPLSVLMAQVWTTPVDPSQIRAAAAEVVELSKSLPVRSIDFTDDLDTERFIAYWFAAPQRMALSRLSTVLRRREDVTRDALTVALSRIVVSKEMMASLARDTSHSRPHKVAVSNSFDVYSGFLRSAHQVAHRLQPHMIKGNAEIRSADARRLEGIEGDVFDAVITSPPYLNAIDYLRGHRLSLVWLGYRVGAIRDIRANNVGAERAIGSRDAAIDVCPFVHRARESRLSSRHLGWIRRYARDMSAVLGQISRVVRQGGIVVVVVGNSFLRGAAIDNAALIETLARERGLRLDYRSNRDIPARRRYLPPPGQEGTDLDSRMRTETVLSFRVD